MTFAFDYGCRSLSYPHSFPTRRSSDLVDIRQEVSLTLRREYETARIEEVNDTPVITVIDPPVPPHERSSPKRLLLVLMALFLGGVIGVVWAYGAEHLEQMRRGNDSEYQELRLVDGS